jgi:prepilin-type N-terminal cleavage/methylation domain-containing protein
MVRRLSSARGFTLVEVLLTIVLVAILAGVSALFLDQAMDLYTLVRTRGHAVYKTDYAMKRILEGAVLITDPGTQISSATSTQFQFVHPTRGTLRYRYSGGNLYERVGSGTERLLADGISTFTFTYYKAGGPLISGNTTTSTTHIAYVQIKISMTTSPNYNTVPIEKGAFLRNRYYVDF